ncbi:MAG: hypothetical protein V4617_15095 [Gemmatimonadota bacterium]
MALLFADSFDHYTAAQSGRKWDSGGVPVTAGFGRRGTAGLNFGQSTIFKNIPSRTRLIAGIAVRPSSSTFLALSLSSPGGIANSQTSKGYVLGFGLQGVSQCGLMFTNDGALHMIRGAAFELSSGAGNIELIASSESGVFSLTGWQFLELDVTFSAAAGAYEARVNGSTVLSGSGVRTINPSGLLTAYPYATQFHLGGPAPGLSGQGWSGRVDDLYLLDATGAKNNSFRGDVRVAYRRPIGAGAASESIIGGSAPAGTRYQSVDDVTPDDDATVVELAADGDRDLYEHEDLPETEATVFAVQGVLLATKADAGIATLTHQQAVNGSDDGGALLHPAGGEYQYLLTPFDQSADGDWTLEKFNDSEFGMKREAA